MASVGGATAGCPVVDPLPSSRGERCGGNQPSGARRAVVRRVPGRLGDVEPDRCPAAGAGSRGSRPSRDSHLGRGGVGSGSDRGFVPHMVVRTGDISGGEMTDENKDDLVLVTGAGGFI